MSYPRHKALSKARTALLLHRRWAYLRYMHMRQGFLSANGVETVLAVGCGRGVAETALALEFPDVHFHLTDIDSERTPNYQQAQDMVREWGVPNVTFGVLDILAKPTAKYDLVTSVEVLEHIEDDRRAAEALSQLARRSVFTLVPYCDAESNEDPSRRQRVWENNEHFVVGYDEARLRELFPGVGVVRGAYWTDRGLALRQLITDMDPSEIQERSDELQEMALGDIRDTVPQRLGEASGIWCLSSV